MITLRRTLCRTIHASLFFLAIVLPVSAHATNFTVTTTTDELDFPRTCTTGESTDCSLREAISEASSDISGDHTIIVPAGTYTLTQLGGGSDEDFNANGDLDISNPEVSITIQGDGIGQTIINGNGSVLLERVIEVALGANVAIEDLTITNGNAEISGNTDGGGINNKGTLTLTRVSVSDSTNSSASGTTLGGGICNAPTGTLTVESSSISGNTSELHGGGIYNDGVVTVSNSVITGNTATHATSPVQGGGVFNGGSLTITNSEVSSNTVTALDNNGYGAGVFTTSNSTLNITNSTIGSNAISTSYDGFGGGVYAYDNTATVSLTFDTIAQNSVVGTNTAFGGGVYADSTFTAVILDGNSATTSDPDCYGAMTSENYNYISSLSSNCTGFNVDTTNLFDTDPGLNDTLTSVSNAPDYFEFSEPGHSPAVNVIPNAFCVSTLGSTPTDETGSTRRGYCDAGAFERQDETAPTVSITDNTDEFNVVECTAEYSEQGATASDDYDSTDAVEPTLETSGTVDADVPGEYPITYTAEDLSANVGSATRTVTVQDTTAPVVDVNGENGSLFLGEEFTTPPDATATDGCDTDVSVEVDNAVDTSVPGEYTVTYTATDANGNVGTATLTITVLTSADDLRTVDTISQDGAVLDVTLSDSTVVSFAPFGSSTAFEYVVSSDNRHVVVTNGKFVRVFVAQNKVAQKKIRTKKLKTKFFALKVAKLYASKTYDDVMVVLSAPAGSAKVVHLRLTAGDELAKFKHHTFTIGEKRKPQHIAIKAAKHRFITRVGSGATKASATWKVTKKGGLLQVQ